MNKIHVYFMPGLAAGSSIFENIHLPEDFETHLLEWEIPLQNESLSNYAKRMSQNITQDNPVLIGVSFGGILVQEIAKHIKTQKVIIISSVKCNKEFPLRMRFAKTTKLYKLLPVHLLTNLERLSQFTLGEKTNKRLDLYQKYLSVRDYNYLKWAIEQVIVWNQSEANKNVIHIHGDQDAVFPIKYISDCIIVKGGTHIMILNKFKWLNKHLPELIRS
ncbi:alpha/beta hydrolase [Flavobacterium agrisoli]|uniref:Alpha/beta hydrolase n=1 Tax=Flavobacterium agrisoli TaxID=2793066 RepID=A0A934PM85_9FLAO|nr:alpha/beta hydrolase [Flavobacterium agrisoli]MBK0370782.1 alpha/beta hydrolase [Flavobacterium agrisoli]